MLKKYKDKWFNARDIAKLLDASFNTVVGNLKRLRKAGIVLFKRAYQVVEPAGRRIVYLYRFKK